MNNLNTISYSSCVGSTPITGLGWIEITTAILAKACHDKRICLESSSFLECFYPHFIVFILMFFVHFNYFQPPFPLNIAPVH